MDRDPFADRIGRLDPEFAEEREFLAALRARANRETSRREAIALAAPQKAIIARPKEGDDLVHHHRRVQRIVQTEAGEAEIHRKGRRDLGAAVVEQVRRVGNRHGNAVAKDVDDHRALVEMPEVEELQPERTVHGAQRGLFAAKPDIAPRIEIEPGDGLRQGGDRRVVGCASQIARALGDIGGAKRRGRRRRFLLSQRRTGQAHERGGDNAGEDGTAGNFDHEACV